MRNHKIFEIDYEYQNVSCKDVNGITWSEPIQTKVRIVADSPLIAEAWINTYHSSTWSTPPVILEIRFADLDAIVLTETNRY